MAKKKIVAKTVESIRHDEATRRTIPTAECEPIVQDAQKTPIRVAYERRNRDLDPQLAWRGKDEQDWSDLVVHAPPLYIQEKVHPKVLIDDLLKQTKAQEQSGKKVRLDLFADFNGVPKGVDKTEYYQHDQNWSNRMILGDSLQVMASLAEHWGRRWITIDTSRVALALARTRIMGARYSYHLLADSREGHFKEARVSGATTPSPPVRGNIRHGFVYERVPHITLKSIANNAEIDVIWEKWRQELEPLCGKLSVACGLKTPLEEWEIPRERPSDWPPATQPLLTSWWEARIARQREIDASIAAKAEFEYLYDKPYEDKKVAWKQGPNAVPRF